MAESSKNNYLINNILTEKYKHPLEIKKAIEIFQVNEYVIFDGLFNNDVFKRLTKECENIFNACEHKDLIMPGYETPRKMHVAGGDLISRTSEMIPYLYVHYELVNFLSKISKGMLHTIKHKEECYVANHLKAKGETHGWHLDDPEFALITVIESPGDNNGGCVEYIKEWQELCLKNKICPISELEIGLSYARKNNLIKSFTLKTGDCYFLNAANGLHRVTPISYEGYQRQVLNMAYDHRKHINFGQTANILYAQEKNIKI